MPNNCFFCQANIEKIDHTKTGVLEEFLTPHGEIIAREHTGVCARHQRQLSKAVERARQMALL